MTETIGKKYSFRELIQEKGYKINIPIIQRDYVQGKPNKEEVRKEFLLTLQRYLDEGINKDLDFVFGYEKNDDFIPLDGQQRLTTLFLLHTYLAIRSDNFLQWKEIISDGVYSKFTYSIRRSSSEFCDGLIAFGFNLEELNFGQGSLKAHITNLNWYKNSWNLDPTVVSMLNMLDEIHSIFYDKPEYYSKLVSATEPIITFLFLDLEALQQGDDLYIKMNARGKTLTPFENFKARFEEKIGIEFENSDKRWLLRYKSKEIVFDTKDYFSFKIDSVWSNLFWKYRATIGDQNTYDEELFNFIKEILLYYYIENNPQAQETIEDILSEDFQSYNQLIKYPLINQQSIIFLIHVLDILKHDEAGLSVYCNNKLFNETDLFKMILGNRIQNPDRIKFFAYLKFLLAFKDDTDGLEMWMRVISNLVDNTLINYQEMIIRAFKSVRDLIPYSKDILTYLSKNNRIAFFDNDQVIEERIKANIIRLKPYHFQKLFLAEQSIFHKGQIGYLLEFSGILYNTDLNSYEIIKPDLLEAQLSELEQISIKSTALFSPLADGQYLLERGILTYGNYLIAKNGRYNFSSSKSVANYDRDYSWKRMLRIEYSDIQNASWFAKRQIFAGILDDANFNFGEVENSLLRRVKEFTNIDWRFDFVKEPAYIRYCKQGFIFTINDFKDIQLLNASQMNHLRRDFHVYKCWLRLDLEKLKRLKPEIIDVKGNSEIPYISLTFTFKSKHYSLEYYNVENNQLHIRLARSTGYNRIQDTDKDISEVAENHGLDWTDEQYHKGFLTRTGNFNKSVSLFKNLINELETI